MFIISEKASNPRVRIAEIESYCIDSIPGGSSDKHLINFFRGDKLLPLSWKYDSKDERDRVLSKVDERLGYDSNSGIKPRKC